MALIDKYQELMTLATRLEIRDFLVKEEGGGIAVDGDTFEKGLAAAVKDNDAQFPPEWRLSYKGRRAET